MTFYENQVEEIQLTQIETDVLSLINGINKSGAGEYIKKLKNYSEEEISDAIERLESLDFVEKVNMLDEKTIEQFYFHKDKSKSEF